MRGGKTNIVSLLYCAASEVTLALFSSLLKLDGTTDLYTELLGLLLTILFSLTNILMIFSECWRHWQLHYIPSLLTQSLTLCNGGENAASWFLGLEWQLTNNTLCYVHCTMLILETERRDKTVRQKSWHRQDLYLSLHAYYYFPSTIIHSLSDPDPMLCPLHWTFDIQCND